MKKKGATRAEIAKARTRDELQALATKYSYSNGWVLKMLQFRAK